MKSVHKSVLLWYTAQEMFDLVADVSSYPQFLPWCDHAKVIETHADGLTAEVGLVLGAVRQSFTTRNTHQTGRRIDIALVSGPFSRLDGHWTFQPLGEPDQRACRVELRLHYGFAGPALARLVGPVFDKVAGSLVDAFVKRAEQIHG